MPAKIALKTAPRACLDTPIEFQYVCPMRQAFTLASSVAANQRAALEHLLYFNVNQERVRLGIQNSIDSYGIPEIVDRNGMLNVKVGSLEGVETLFAVSEYGHPLGVAIFVRSASNRIVVLHLGVQPRTWSNNGINTQVLLELVQEIHRAAKRAQGIDRIEVVYSRRDSARGNAAHPAAP
jgi:hypothetical protein